MTGSLSQFSECPVLAPRPLPLLPLHGSPCMAPPAWLLPPLSSAPSPLGQVAGLVVTCVKGAELGLICLNVQ